MKAFILCAGLGTRLRPISNQIPKCLVEVKGTSLLEQNRFQDQLYPEYSQEGIRIYLELKGLGSIGQKINQYIKPLKLQ